MAVFHLNLKIVRRSQGGSAVAAAAYRARTELTNERTGETWNYSRNNRDVLFAGIFLPKGAPEWMSDRAQLWNGIEKAERYKNAQLARDFTIALPHELTLEQQTMALKDFVRDNFTRKGLVADVAIHRPGREGDNRNTHAHILVTMRKVQGFDFAPTKERFEGKTPDKTQLIEWRDSWEKIANDKLRRFAPEAKPIDRRTLEAQGIAREPTIHLGPKASDMERRGMVSDRGEEMHNIRQRNLANQIVAELKPYAPESAVERQLREEQVIEIADRIHQTGASNRGRGVPHYVRELLSAFHRLSVTMGHVLGDMVRPGAPQWATDRVRLPDAETFKQRATVQEIHRTPEAANTKASEPRPEVMPVDKLREKIRDVVAAKPSEPKAPDKRTAAQKFFDRVKLDSDKTNRKSKGLDLDKNNGPDWTPDGPDF